MISGITAPWLALFVLAGCGGVGDFDVFRRDPGRNGHFIINDPERWGATADAYIDGIQATG